MAATVVQSTTATMDGEGSLALSALTAQAGDALVVLVAPYSVGDTSLGCSVSDSVNGSWASAVVTQPLKVVTDGLGIHGFVYPASAAGSVVITVDPAGGEVYAAISAFVVRPSAGAVELVGTDKGSITSSPIDVSISGSDVVFGCILMNSDDEITGLALTDGTAVIEVVAEDFAEIDAYRHASALQWTYSVTGSIRSDSGWVALGLREVPPPTIDSVTPDSFADGASVSIAGSDFGASQGDGAVFISAVNHISGQITPVIESGDATNSGNNTAESPWAVARPTASAGDLLLLLLAWDDSTNVTAVTPANGPNGETWTAIGSVQASNGTEVRCHAFYTIATGAWGAGTISVTPSSSEQWTATVVKVPAGEFNASTPVAAAAANSSAGTAESTISSPAITVGSNPNARVVWIAAADDDPQSSLVTGWTEIANVDRGAVSLSVQIRDAATVASESISAGAGTRAIASDSWCGKAFLVLPPAALVEEQTVDAWSDTAIDITAVKGSLPLGGAYVFVVTDAGQANATGFPVTFVSGSTVKKLAALGVG